MPHHILLVSLDALRPDKLGHQALAPNIHRIGVESVVFSRATSPPPATWTLPGHMSMLSGLEPPVHGCTSARHRYPPDSLPFPLLFELLGAAGYATQAVTGGGYMEPQFGFGRGVDRFDVIGPIDQAQEALVEHMVESELTVSFLHTYMVHDYPLVQSCPHALQLVQEEDPDYRGFFPTDKDFHSLMRALAASADAVEVTARDLRYLELLYAAAIRSADASLAGLVRTLEQRELWEDTTLILTADHGESMGEVHAGQRYWSHGGPPYQEQIRVPLLIRPAVKLRDVMEPGQSDEPVSLVDIVPTLLDLADVPFSRGQFDGTSLVDLCMGQVAAFETRTLVHHSCEDPDDRYLDSRLYATTLPWKGGSLLHDHRTRALREYYLLQTDPDEKDNRIDTLSHDELKRIEEMITDYWARVQQRAHHPPSATINDPMVLERLAQLGYIEEH